MYNIKMTAEEYNPGRKIQELNPKPELLSLLERIEGLAREDAQFLIILNQKVGEGELGNVLFAIRHTLSAIVNPQKFIHETNTFKNYEQRLYHDFHKQRKLKGLTGPVKDEEVKWGDHLSEFLNMDPESFSQHLKEKYLDQMKKSSPSFILREAATDFRKVISRISQDNRDRLFHILGIVSVTDEGILFSDHLISTPLAAEKQSDFVKKIAAALSGNYREAIDNNPSLDPETYQAIKETGQHKALDPEMIMLNFERMPTESLIRGLTASNMTEEMREGALNVFLKRCNDKLSPSEYKLFERQVLGLASQKDWMKIVELAEAHLESKK